jgi:hypothetical protein
LEQSTDCKNLEEQVRKSLCCYEQSVKSYSGKGLEKRRAEEKVQILSEMTYVVGRNMDHKGNSDEVSGGHKGQGLAAGLKVIL